MKKCNAPNCDSSDFYGWRAAFCKEHERLRGRQAYQKHKAKVLARQKKDYGTLEYFHQKLVGYRNWDKRQKLKSICDVSADHFLWLSQFGCTYCGNNSSRIGLDRIDNGYGHSIDNVVPCCKTCNISKQKLTVDKYIQHCRAVSAFALRRSA